MSCAADGTRGTQEQLIGGVASHPWITTWGAAMEEPLFDAPVIENQTLRQIVRVSLGGASVRVRLSNTFGTSPLTIDAASIAVRANGPNIIAGTLRALTFAGKRTVTIPPGAEVLSDSAALEVPDGADLAVSMFLAKPALTATQLNFSHQTSYLSWPGLFSPGDYTSSTRLDLFTTTESWYWLSAVEVLHPGASTIVTLGDSITEGFGSTADASARWPDVLARRLLDCDAKLGVSNSGLSGNRVLNEGLGPKLLSRLERDMLERTGTSHVILLEGINDIGYAAMSRGDLGALLPPGTLGPQISADDIIAGYRHVAAQAHAAGLTISIGTLLPMAGAFYYDDEAETTRQAVNAWIRRGEDFDAILDFDAALRDPANPRQLLAAYDSGDSLHPNDAGYEAMAHAIDLQLFMAGAACK